MADIEKKYIMFTTFSKKYRYEANRERRQRLANVLFRLKLYSDVMLDKEDLSESEKTMLEHINKRNILPC